MIALTFDDGPNFGTEAILYALQTRKLKATLFVNADNGNSLTAEGKCGALRRAAGMGMQIESHGQKHMNFVDLTTDAQMKTELVELEKFLKNCGIRTKVRFYRPPYGNLRKDQAQWIYRNFNYTVAFWSSQTDDTVSGSTLQTRIASLDNTMPNPSTGASSVVLAHDAASRDNVGQWLDHIIKKYKGYKFVTINECWAACKTWQRGVKGRVCKDPLKTMYTLAGWQ